MNGLAYPALHATHGGVWIAHPDGRTEAVGRGQAIARAAETPMILLNAPLVASRLGYPDLSGLDLLELFAFVLPACFAVPTPHGIADALSLEAPAEEADAAAFLRAATARLLDMLGTDWPQREGAWTSAQALARASEYVRGADAPRYVIVQNEEGWREALLAPAAAED